MSRLYLLRERAEKSEIVTEVHVYSQPDRSADTDELSAPTVAARQAERAEWAQMIDVIRRSA
jgi:hypothetical protein